MLSPWLPDFVIHSQCTLQVLSRFEANKPAFIWSTQFEAPFFTGTMAAELFLAVCEIQAFHHLVRDTVITFLWERLGDALFDKQA